MAWTQKPYCTVDDVKSAYDKRTATDDDLIQSFIPIAQEKIDTYVGYPFQTDGPAATRTYDGNGSDQLLIDRIVTLTTVKVQTYSFGTDPVTGAITRTADTPTDITQAIVTGPVNADHPYLLQHLSSTFPLGKRNIVVTGTFGYSSIPKQVSRACVLEVIAMLDARKRGYQHAIATPTSNDSGAQAPDNLCAEARALLDRFRRIKFRMA